jgi:hypothetical protein
MTEVAGIQPAVAEHFGGFFGPVPVALHDVFPEATISPSRMSMVVQLIAVPAEPMSTCPGWVKAIIGAASVMP